MKNVGVIGLGDMGSGIALNLIKNGFKVFGSDLLPARQEAFKKMGGSLETSIATLGKKCDAVFVMVMNGDQAKSIIFDKDGLAKNMSLGSEQEQLGAGFYDPPTKIEVILWKEDPVKQGQDFDKDGEYTKKYLPQLSNMPDKYLFNPWEAPKELLADAGVKLGENYPHPIVELKSSRENALASFDQIKKKK